MTTPAESDRRGGFTLLEVIVAIGMMAGGFLAVAQLLVAASRLGHLSRVTATATRAAAAKLEGLRSPAWGCAADGTNVGTLATSPAGALASDTAGFVDYLDAAGAPVGSGLSPPAEAMFVRRWSVEQDDEGVPARTVRLAVVVRRREISEGGVPGGSASWIETIRLVGARTRRPG